MTYMTFKIKVDWLFKVLFGLSCAANIFILYLFFVSIANGQVATIVLSTVMGLLITACNVYVVISMTKNYKIGLTKDSVKICDISNVVIPYTSIRSIKKDRQPSKYKLYDALLVIKYNKYDTVKINCVDLENTFDNLKEMVQKANLDKVVNNVVTMKDGSKEIQQAVAGQTNIIPATTAPSGQTIIKPASQMGGAQRATNGALVRPNSYSQNIVNPQQTNGALVRQGAAQQTSGAMVRPNNGYSQNIVNPQQTSGAMVRPNNGYSQNIVNPQQTSGAMVRPNNGYSQNIVNPQQTSGAMVRPVTRPVTPNQNQQVAGAIVRPNPTAVPTQPAKTVTTTTTTTTKAVPVSSVNAAQPTTTTQTIINPDGSKRVVTTTQTTKLPE